MKVLFCAGIIFLGLLFSAYKMDEMTCNNGWKDSGIPHRYDFYSGCMLKVKSGWIPAKNYREAQ